MFDPVIAFTLLVTVYGYLMGLIAISAQHHLARNQGEANGCADDLLFALVVPALNEEKVIAKTVESLLGLSGNFIITVIDDASDDGTVEALTPYLSDPRVSLLQRVRPKARTGKGDSLNAAFNELLENDRVQEYGPDRVIVVVFDSDGRVDSRFLEAVEPFFDDPETAGVQSAVRMYNASQNLLTFWQHFEFLVWGEVMCRAKDLLGSATLGGNGQCVRMSALLSLGPNPWHASLVDDLDLALRLLALGWRLHFCPWVAVWQEAVPDLRRLVRQRSRWMQGHIASWNYIPKLITSRLPLHTRIDLLFFLLLPATFVPIGVSAVVSWVMFGFHMFHVSDLHAESFVAWYVLGFAMVPLSMWAWRQTSDRPSVWRAIGVCHVYVFYSFIWFLAALWACWNVFRVQRSWAKTSRVGVTAAQQPYQSTAVSQ